MTSESLREQVEKRIAEMEEQLADIPRYNFNPRIAAYKMDSIKVQISFGKQVLTLIDEKAKELEEKQNEYSLAYKLEQDRELKQNYLGRKLTYSHARHLLVGQPKQIEVNPK